MTLAASVTAGGAAYWCWRDLRTGLVPPAGGVLVTIGPGESFRRICERLESAGVVRYGAVLRLWARWQGVDRLVRSGEYRFDRALSPIDVLAVLRSPSAAVHWVTIREGATVADVAAVLAVAGFGGTDHVQCLARDPSFLVDVDVPASGLEGYLFPDTYAFAWSASPEEILRAMVRRFREHAAAVAPARAAARMSEAEMVILASVIEKETGAALERPVVSGVFHNRLRIGMALQSDPTAVYGRTDVARPTAADLKVDNPYNTYRHAGLPPGPICNPGRAALEAAVTPAQVPYLYFVSRNDGTHEFSATLAAHNRAVARYQRRRGAP